MLTGSLIKFCIHYSYSLFIIVFIIHCHKGSITIIDGYICRRQVPSTKNLISKLKLFANKSEQEESPCESIKYGTPLDLMPFLMHLDYLLFFASFLSRFFFCELDSLVLVLPYLSCKPVFRVAF